jgi:hypothetical protein
MPKFELSLVKILNKKVIKLVVLMSYEKYEKQWPHNTENLFRKEILE